MSSKTHAKGRHGRKHKREQFSKPARRNTNLILGTVIVGLLVVIGYLVARRFSQAPEITTASAKTIQLAQGATSLRIPLSEVNDGRAKFFEAALSDGKSVRFFVLRTSDGIYRTALDACEVCFYEHKGYYQDGDEMVCRKCGRHFSVDYWTVELSRDASRDEVLTAFSRNTRIAFIRASEGVTALNVTADLMLELGRPRGAMWEVALWEDILTVEGREAYYAYQVDNQAIVIPENIDAIRALAGREQSAQASIERTNQTLGVRQRFV